MDFDFTDEQRALRDLARDVLAREWPVSRLRQAWDGKPRDRAVWRTLGDVGLLGVTVPEEHGGTGGDLLDLILVLEEAGRAGLPEPLVETVAVAAPVLAAHGPEELRGKWLPAIASGEALVTVGPFGRWFVPDADLADLLLLIADGSVHVLPGPVPGERLRSEDAARRLFVTAEPTPENRMAGEAAAEHALRLGTVATAAFLNGVSARLLETTVEHVRSRQQFGRPVGSFQAVKHKLANVHTALEAATAAVRYGAYAVARDLPDADVAGSVAKIAANDAAALANTEALQCHGGIGFTWEHDLHLWLKRGKALEAAWGTSPEHRARLAPHLFADPARDHA